MDRFRIQLKGKASVEEYLRIMDHYEGTAEIISEASTVDGKSVLGLFSLDLTKPVELVLYEEDPQIRKELERFRA